MSDKLSLQDLLEVQKYFGLPSPALVEKDWYVVKAISAIASIDTSPFQLVFNGGTALSRAYRLIGRMSDDIDLKIISTGHPQRQAYRKLRDTVTEALLKTGFQFDPGNPLNRESGDASRYTLYRLPYSPIIVGEGAPRPEIQIETAVWPIRLPMVPLSVISFLAEAFKDPPEVPTIPCVALAEMIAEKFVALTRQAGAELAKAGGPRDPALVRHIYDLHMTRPHYGFNTVAELACEIMLADVEAYGNQFPAYRANPIGETLRAVKALAADSTFADRYETFQRDMVYGERADFAIAVDTVLTLAKRITAMKAGRG